MSSSGYGSANRKLLYFDSTTACAEKSGTWPIRQSQVRPELQASVEVGSWLFPKIEINIS